MWYNYYTLVTWRSYILTVAEHTGGGDDIEDEL